MEERFEYIQCLFCVTGREAGVVRALEETEGVRAVFPQKVKAIWRNGAWGEELFPLFPGYVFVYSHQPLPYAGLNGISGVLRVLSYDKEGREGYLIENDRRFAELLLRLNGVIGALDALPDGNFVRVDEGALRLLNGRVAKVDKRKRLVNVEFDILGDTRSAWLTYRLPEDGMSADD